MIVQHMYIMLYESHDISIAKTSSRADPMLGLNIYRARWRHLNI